MLGWVRSRFPSVNGAPIPWPATLTDFVSKHRERDSGLLGLLQAAHGIVSGIEKNVPPRASQYLKQDATHVWLASAFGEPRRNLLADPPEVLTIAGWRRLLDEARRILEEIRQLGQGDTGDVGAWRRWRDSAAGPKSLLRAAFSFTIAETRLPNNDVTLWDQSYVAAALFKSAVAGALLEGKAFPGDSTELKQTTRWRLLTVGVGSDHYEARAVRIGDWTGAWAAIREFFDRVRKLVEVDLAIGSLLYGDTSVEVFSFPGERSKRSTADGDLRIPSWESWLQAEVERIARELELETPPLCRISEPTRSLVPMVRETRQARSSLAMPLHRSWRIQDDQNGGHVCPVCLVRLNSRPDDKKRPCAVCGRRRRGRLDAWLNGKLGTDTIWVNEVADASGRLALITLSLDIEPWLDGRRMDSLRTQAISEWRRFNPTLDGRDNPIDPAEPFESLIDYVRRKLGAYDQKDPVLTSLQEGYRHDSDWPSFFAKIVEDRSDAPSWDKLDEAARAHWVVHQLFTKLPSPGRVYRFWQQAEEFFATLAAEFRQLAARSPNHWRVRRLVLIPDGGSADRGWEDGEIYEGHLNGTLVDVLYRDRRFLTTSNLARLLAAQASRDDIKGREIQLRGDDRVARTLRIADVKEAGPLRIYYPVVLLELSPLRFRALVPLEAASGCLDRAIEMWNEEFGRVWDRLPLSAGIVGFPQKLPLQAVLEAVRTIEHGIDGGESQTWRVRHRDERGGVVSLVFLRPDGGSELRTIPVALPDGRLDVFYPYLAVTDDRLRFPRDFPHPEGQVYRHALDLRPGDEVQVQPARVATVFLDSAGRRFELVRLRPLADWSEMGASWELVRRAAPSMAALHAVRAELVSRREAWQGPDGRWAPGAEQAWARLAEAVLADRLGAEGPALRALVEAARDGILEWALDWHLSVLKETGGEVRHG